MLKEFFFPQVFLLSYFFFPILLFYRREWLVEKDKVRGEVAQVEENRLKRFEYKVENFVILASLVFFFALERLIEHLPFPRKRFPIRKKANKLRFLLKFYVEQKIAIFRGFGIYRNGEKLKKTPPH